MFIDIILIVCYNPIVRLRERNNLTSTQNQTPKDKEIKTMKKMTFSHYACITNGTIIATFKTYNEAVQLMTDLFSDHWELYGHNIIRVYARG